MHAAFYPLTGALVSVWGVDFGVNRELLTAKGPRPRIMLDMTHYLFWGNARPGEPNGGFRWFPDLSLVATWDLGARPHRVYLGVDVFSQTVPSLHVYPSPIFGTELRASKVVAFQLELAWNAPWKDTTFSNPVWYGPGSYGAIAFRLGLNFYVPKKNKDDAGEVAL